MPQLKARELAEKNEAELEEMAQNCHVELRNIRFQMITGQQKNTSRAGQVRKELARIRTVQRQRELTAEMEGEHDA
ncbi:MAG: 50S ribosomal protein L29 [Caldilineaceae bacterium]|nr:50S ribosomal protein L29 [Caldilineaceae bacterium]